VAVRGSAHVLPRYSPPDALDHAAVRGQPPPPARTQADQERRLRRLIRHAAEHSPFYADKYRGLDLDRCGLTDLPTVTKAELMADFDRAVTDPTVRRADLEAFVDDPANVGRRFLGRYPVCHTSGSQGQPMLVVQDQLTLDLLFAFQMTRGNVNYRFGPWEVARRFFSPARLAVLVSKPGFYPSAWVWNHLPAAMRPYIELLYLQGNDPDLVGRLNAFRPTVLTATPTTLDLLAVKADLLRLGGLTAVVASSETLTPQARARIQGAFRVPVLDNYAMGECVFLGSGCPTDPGVHVNADWCVAEVVDAGERPVPAGQTGDKVLVTNLANTTLPFIRYEVGDRLTMATAPCRCGSTLPLIERVDGRVAEVFWVRAGAGYRAVTAHPFQHAFEHVREAREWQATQTDRNRVVIRVEALPGAEVDLRRAAARVAERLGLTGFTPADLHVELETVATLAADDRTGKFRRMISLVGPPTDLPRPEGAVAAAGT
jgi:phenylacetate-coenzyme A ligase PaaK-like adenylate-forming protein